MTLSCLRPSLPAALAPRAAGSPLRDASSRRCAVAKRSPALAALAGASGPASGGRLAGCSPPLPPPPPPPRGPGPLLPLPAAARSRPAAPACRAARVGRGGGKVARGGGGGDRPPPPPSTSVVDAAGSLAALLLWGALLVYALNFSPNQTPARDMYLLAKLVPGSGAPDDGVAINQVVAALFNAMGVMPALYAALLVPAGRSGGAKKGGGGSGGDGGGFAFPPRLPAFPFIVGSFALGFFALGPYLALWTPAPRAEDLPESERDGPRDATAPPRPAALERNGAAGSVALRALESPITAVFLLLGALSQAYLAATAGPAAWGEFARLFDESRLVHVTSLDFLALSSFVPFWVSLDAGSRGWSGLRFAAALGAVPLVGPALYLALRPRARWEKEGE